MHESFLHYLWRTRRFDAHNLLTTCGQIIDIQHVGTHNVHAGPDFFDARLRIGDTLWAGNVEMHLRASEWMVHQHHLDPAYENVVLHVVLDDDVPVLRNDGTPLPCLSLQGRIPARLLEQYRLLEQEREWIPCRKFIGQTSEILRLNWLDRLLVERLEEKTGAVAALMELCRQHVEEAFYVALARNFGLKINTEPFEALARSLPLKILLRHRDNLLQTEALLFGQAGMLQGHFDDEWPRALQREYRHLAHKYELQALSPGQWKFLRLRPASFPSVRIAQFAALFHREGALFSKIQEMDQLKTLEELFAVQPGSYWDTRYIFDRASSDIRKTPGQHFIHLLVINTIAPFLFYYGRLKGIDRYEEQAIALLEAVPPESNPLINNWKDTGIKARNAFDTQALLQLKTRYCDYRKCLDCAIGNAILK